MPVSVTSNGQARDGRRLRESRIPGSVVTRGGEARVAHLRAAMRTGGLRLFAQPIVDVRTGEGAGEELLLRLVRSNGRVELPGPYLCAAEQYSLAVEVDAWVVEQAARLAAGGRRLHVNLSARSFAEGTFANRVGAAFMRYGTDPSLITFEITETASALETWNPGHSADRIVALGSSLALDDFGTGYGTLTYLHRLPVSMVKIDRQFMADLVTDPRARTIVDSVVQIARSLDLVTVAEGIEDAETLAVTLACGVDRAQGFHTGCPVPV